MSEHGNDSATGTTDGTIDGTIDGMIGSADATANDWLAERFEENRTHLRAVAFRMLGSTGEADDAVQEAWIRLSRSDASEIDNLGGWLTTVVARVSLDILRSRTSRREDPHGVYLPEDFAASGPDSGAGGTGMFGAGSSLQGIDPEHEAVLADSLGQALIVVLETLAPAERLAFVLHDLFAVPFDEIGEIVGRSPAATRQLASRARRRVQGVDPDAAPPADVSGQREVVQAFLAASRGGDFDALLAVLDPDVVVRADTASVRMGAAAEVRGRDEVVGTFAGRAKAAKLALVDGVPGMVWSHGGETKVVFEFTVRDGKVVAIDMFADPKALGEIEVALLPE